MSADRVEVGRFTSRMEADLVKMRLSREGISARVSADDCGGLRPELQFSIGAAVMVAADDSQRARELLERIESDGHEADETPGGEEG